MHIPKCCNVNATMRSLLLCWNSKEFTLPSQDEMIFCSVTELSAAASLPVEPGCQISGNGCNRTQAFKCFVTFYDQRGRQLPNWHSVALKVSGRSLQCDELEIKMTNSVWKWLVRLIYILLLQSCAPTQRHSGKFLFGWVCEWLMLPFDFH